MFTISERVSRLPQNATPRGDEFKLARTAESAELNRWKTEIGDALLKKIFGNINTKNKEDKESIVRELFREISRDFDKQKLDMFIDLLVKYANALEAFRVNSNRETANLVDRAYFDLVQAREG